MTVSGVRSSSSRSTSSAAPSLSDVAAGRAAFRRGMRGESVKQLQQLLNRHGANLTADGDFGPKTEAAVRAFQQQKRLSVDGIAGKNTVRALQAGGASSAGGPAPTASGPTLRQGARGEAVRFLQQKLRANGFNVAVDGDFGPRTALAVKGFQRTKGLTADGVVGPRTWGALGGGPPAGSTGSVGGGSAGPTRRVTGYSNGRAYPLDVALVENGKYLAAPAAAAYKRMDEAARRDGVSLNLVSGFRSMAEQQELYRRYRNGTGNLAARPGYSNHQNGIAADIQTGGSRSSAAYRWLAANGARYGFRNTVPSEPWHWEYRP